MKLVKQKLEQHPLTPYQRPRISIGRNEQLHESLFLELWPVVLKVWKNHKHCMFHGCSRETFTFYVADNDHEMRRWGPGLGRAVLMEGVKRGWLTKGKGTYGHSTFTLVDESPIIIYSVKNGVSRLVVIVASPLQVVEIESKIWNFIYSHNSHVLRKHYRECKAAQVSPNYRYEFEADGTYVLVKFESSWESHKPYVDILQKQLGLKIEGLPAHEQT